MSVRILTLDVTDAEIEALETALLRAKASERSEATRGRVLVSTGYGDRAGGTLADESDRATLRAEVLGKVYEALRLSES